MDAETVTRVITSDVDSKTTSLFSQLVLLETNGTDMECRTRRAVIRKLIHHWSLGHHNIKVTCSCEEEQTEDANFGPNFNDDAEQVLTVKLETRVDLHASDVPDSFSTNNDDDDAASSSTKIYSPEPPLEVCKNKEKLHRTQKKKRRSYSCVKCGRSLASIARLKKHMTSEHEEEVHESTASNTELEPANKPKRTFICLVCGIRLMSKILFKKHMNSNHPEEAETGNTEMKSDSKSQQFVCTMCGRCFRLRQLLAAHMVTHTGDRPYACRYPNCTKRFGQPSSRNSHERTHSEARPYVCSNCGQSYKQPSYLKIHMSALHGTDAKPHKCTMCDKTFKIKRALLQHVRGAHVMERTQACDKCPKTFKTSQQLRRHRRALHDNERPWKCTLCDRVFAQPGNLRTHMRTHTGEKPYSCVVCGLNFAHSGTLKGHMATHKILMDMNERITCKETGPACRVDDDKCSP